EAKINIKIEVPTQRETPKTTSHPRNGLSALPIYTSCEGAPSPPGLRLRRACQLLSGARSVRRRRRVHIGATSSISGLSHIIFLLLRRRHGILLVDAIIISRSTPSQHQSKSRNQQVRQSHEELLLMVESVAVGMTGHARVSA